MFTTYIYSCGVQQNWIFYFMIFLWFTMIFQRFNWNFFKKEKDKTKVTVAKHGYCSDGLQNQLPEVKCTIWKVEGGEVPGFVVAGGKPNFHDSWRR